MVQSNHRVLVTGGAGFLGSHLTKRMLDGGYAVIVLDDLSTGSLKNLVDCQKNENFTFIEHDIIEPIDLDVDWIFNLACPASPIHYQKDPIKTTKTSVFGALNMLELAKKHGARILQASTSEVYGDPLEHPQTEKYRGQVNCTGIRACYDEGKRCAESLFFDYHRMYDVDIKVVRIFNTYGPNMDVNDGRVVSNFIIQALRGQPLTVYGDGSQTRSFCYVDDLIDGIIAMMESDATITGPINLGNSDEFTMLDLVRLVRTLTESSSAISFKPLPQDDPAQRKPDITLASTRLGWSPKIDLRTGIERTIEYFIQELG